MPKRLVRRGRVRGYRPTREQLEEVLELAQRGIAKDAATQLKYAQGNEEIYSYGKDGRITSENLNEIIKEAHNPSELNNLNFSIIQDSPVRKVDIEVGVNGDWTNYLIESEDQTWAYGRYHELTEKLLANRSLFAMGRSPSPEVLQVGTDDKWRPAAWELAKDWRANICGGLTPLLSFFIVIEIVFIGYYLGEYYGSSGDTTKAAISAKHQAELVLHWLNGNLATIFLINFFYIWMIIALRRWAKYFLKSTVTLQSNSLFSHLIWRKDRSDLTQIIGLYLTFMGVIVSIMALIFR